MNNLRILGRNRIEEATSVLASPSVLATLPETNLLLPTEHGRVARSTSLASQKYTFSWAADQNCNMIAVSRHNLGVAGTICGVAYDSYPTVLHDTTPLPAFSTSGLDTELDDDITDIDFEMLKNWVSYFDLVTEMGSLELTLNDPTNPALFLQLTKPFAGKYFELTYNPGGVEFTMPDSSEGGFAEDKTHIVDRGALHREILIQLEAIPNASDLKTLKGIARRIGKHGECWLDPYPHNTDAMGIYARGAYRLMDSPTFNHAQYGNHKNTMKFVGT